MATSLARLPVSLIFALGALWLLASHSLAQPSIALTVTTPEATYQLRDNIPVALSVRNTTPAAEAQGDGAVPSSDQIDAANTAVRLRVVKVLLTGTDIYGNPVNIATTSYGAADVNDLSFPVPAALGDIAPDTTVDFTLNITIPDDGTLHDVINPGYSVQVTVEWVVPARPWATPPVPASTGTNSANSAANTLISVTPNLQLPSVSCPPNPKQFRGGDVVRFNSFVLNSLTGDGTRQSRPMRSVEGDIFRVSTHLTTDPAYGSTTPNNDDYELYFTDILGDLGEESAPDGQSTIRTVRVFDTPGALPAYGDPDPALGPLPNATSRLYTPQPDDGFLDIGEVLNIEYDVLVPQNFPGIYFIAGMVDSLSQIDEPLGANPARESPPREPEALVNDNTYIDRSATKFVISSTGNDNSPDVGLVSGTVSPTTGAVTTVANNDSDLAAISGQGEVVAFVSYATNLASSDVLTNGRRQIYAKLENPQTGALTAVIVSQSTGGVIGNGDSFNPMVSSDGRFVVFESNASNLVASDSNGQTDIFVRDLLLNLTTRVSLDSLGLQAAGSSLQPSISDNGRYVAFHSNARNLATNPTSTRFWGSYQVFVVDRDKNNNGIFDQQGDTATYLASVNRANVPANSYTFFARISGDGRFLAYASYATNLDPATTRLPYSSVYRVPLQSGVPLRGQLDLVSRATGLVGAVGDGQSYEISVNRNGKHIAFSSLASNLVRGDSNGVSDIFVRDYSNPARPKTVRVSVSSQRSATGVLTVLGSPAVDNIPTGNANINDTVQFGPSPGETLTFGGSLLTDPSVGPEATDSRDNLTTSINALSPTLGIVAESSTPVLPLASFIVSPTSFNPSIFLFTLSPGVAGDKPITTSATMETTGMTGGGTQANDPATAVVGIPIGSNMPSIDASGRFVAFRTVATNLDVYRPNLLESPLEPPRTRLRNGELIRPLFNRAGNVYVHDRQITGQGAYDAAGNFGSTRVSVSKFGYKTTSLLNTSSSANSHAPSISANGQYIAFSSDAENNGGIIFGRTNLDPLDSNGFRDVFIFNRRFAGTEQEAPRRVQYIAFGALPSPRFGSVSTISLDALASSGLPLTYTSSDTKVAKVSGSSITIVGAGSATITARQAGDSSWAPASQTRTLIVQKGQQTIDFRPSFALSGGYLLPSFAPRNSTAGLLVTYRSANSSVAQIFSGNIIKLTGRGYTTITATQTGNGNYNAAPSVSRRVGRK